MAKASPPPLSGPELTTAIMRWRKVMTQAIGEHYGAGNWPRIEQSPARAAEAEMGVQIARRLVVEGTNPTDTQGTGDRK